MAILKSKIRKTKSSPTCEQIVRILKKNRRKIKTFGVKRLGIFGSVARNEAGPRSDVDFLVDFHETTYRQYVGLKTFLETLLGRKVDLLTPPALEARLKDNITKDIVYVADE